MLWPLWHGFHHWHSSLTWVPHLIRLTTIRCSLYFVNSSASAQLCWTSAETSCVTARKPSRLGHSYRNPTTFSAVCPKGPFWVQRSLLLTQKTWQMLSVEVNLVITCMPMTRNSWSSSISLRFHQWLRHCSAVFRRFAIGVRQGACSWILPKVNWSGLDQGLIQARLAFCKVECMDLSLHVGKETIKPASVVRDLGVLLDEELTMNQHISKTVCVAFYHIQWLRKVWSILGVEITAALVSAFILSRLDYCNAVLAHLLGSTIAPLYTAFRMWQHDCMMKDLRPRDQVTSALWDL